MARQPKYRVRHNLIGLQLDKLDALSMHVFVWAFSNDRIDSPCAVQGILSADALGSA